MTNPKYQNQQEWVLFVTSNNDLYLPIDSVMATTTLMRLMSKRLFQNLRNRIAYTKSNIV